MLNASHLNITGSQGEPDMAVGKRQIAEVEKVIEEMNLEELLALQGGLKERITALRDEAKDKFIADMKAKAEQLGLGLEDLAPMLGFGRSAIGRKNGVMKNGSAAVKYRNPKNHSETWSGRGRRARWITREMAARGLSEKAEVPSEFLVG
jgi:DNA-binding protein H-NS